MTPHKPPTGPVPERRTGGPRGPAWGRPAGLGAWVWGGTPHGDGCSVGRVQRESAGFLPKPGVPGGSGCSGGPVGRVGGNRRFLESRASRLFPMAAGVSRKPGVLMVINAATEVNQRVFLTII